MSDKVKTEIISVLNTALTSFVVSVGASLLLAGHIEWTLAFWGTVATAGGRAVWKAVLAQFLPERLGGVR